MSKKFCFGLWAGLFVLSAGLGFLPEPTGPVKIAMTFLSILFFLPPAYLTYRAEKQGDRHTLKLIRNLSGASLGLTLVLLICNFMTLMAPEFLGNLLYTVLVIVSSPMICSGFWALSLFLWACLLMTAMKLLKKRR